MIDTYEAPLIVVDEYNRRYINPERLGENGFELRLDNYPLTIGASTQALSGFSIPEEGAYAGDFEAAGLVAMGTAPFRIEMSEVGVEANAFMNAPIHRAHCSGYGGLPFVFAETCYFPAGRFVQVTVTNLGSISNVVRMALVGRSFTKEMKPEIRERRAAFLADRPTRPFWLALDNGFSTLTAGQTGAEAFMTMPSGSHFTLEDLMWEATGHFEMALFDGQTGRQLTFGQGGTGFIDIRMIAGNGRIPAKYLGAPLMEPRRTLRILMNDLANNGNNTVHLTAHGRRIKAPVASE